MHVQNTRAAALRLISGYRVSRMIGVFVELGLADRLAGGAATADELAEFARAHADSVRRMLRLLVAAEVLDEDDGGRYSLTPLGEELRSDRLGPLARFYESVAHWQAWSRADHSVRTGERAFDLVHGMRNWDFYAKNPAAGAVFDAAMSSNTVGLARAIVGAFDFSPFGVVADIGGGDGTLLSEVLRTNPSARGMLFDLPGVVERARARMAERGLLDRCELVAGSFLEHVPPGADAYVMKAILHDWEDISAVAIVSNIRAAGEAGSRLLVVERILSERVGRDDLDDLMTDVNMLVNNGGRERTEAEFAHVLASGGYRLQRTVLTGTSVSVLEAVAV